jgi:hypothetical protein
MERIMDGSEQGQALSYEVNLGSGKILRVVNDRILGMWKAEFSPGGELPSSLTGRYTSFGAAVEAVQRYISERERKAAQTKAKAKVSANG